MANNLYTTQLQAGLGMIEETRALLDLWQEGMDTAALYKDALASGRFPNVAARRLRNIVAECFAPRFLTDQGRPVRLLKMFLPILSNREFEQLLFIYTCRANVILADFVREVYWKAYASGHLELPNDNARDFVTRANQNGKMQRLWSPGTIRRVAAYLTGCCADFGLLDRGQKVTRRILPYHIEPRVSTILSHEVHFAGQGDNQVIASPDWTLFGMEYEDVLNELKRISLKGLFIIQMAGGVTRISWRYQDLKELADVLAEG